VLSYRVILDVPTELALYLARLAGGKQGVSHGHPLATTHGDQRFEAGIVTDELAGGEIDQRLSAPPPCRHGQQYGNRIALTSIGQ